jgi:integrase
VGVAGHARRTVGLVYLDELAADWVEWLRENRSPSYADQGRSVLGSLLDATPPRMPVAALLPSHVSAVLEAAAARGCAHKTLNDYRRVMSAFCSWAIDRGLMKKNAAIEAPLPRGRASKPRQYLAPEFVGPFLAACTREFRPIASCAILAGLRRVEVVRLQWENVLDDRLLITSAKKRTPEIQEVPLHPRLASELYAVELEKLSDVWVFPIRKEGNGRRRGEQRSERSRWFLQQTKYAADRIGLPPKSVTFHGLRHTFGQLVQEVSGDAWLAGQLLRHSSSASKGRESTVSHLYFQVQWKRAAEVVNAINVDELRPVRRVGR